MHRLALAAMVVVALALPAVASAHPQVYSLTPKKLPTGTCTNESDPTGACLENGAKRYAVANDGYAMSFTENGEAASGGVINYQLMPGGFRKWTGGEMSPEQKRTFAPAQTELQAHATCSGVAALESGPTILAWQGSDPFFDYIPWQKTSAGLGDVPAEWIAVVEEKTGVDLAALAGEAEFKAACEGLGGAYRKVDAASNPATNSIADAVEKAIAPLEAEIGALLGAKSSLQAQIDAWSAKGQGLEAANAALIGEKASLELRVGGLKQANANKGKTIKSLRKQLKAARNG
jgi:hypothetical protein